MMKVIRVSPKVYGTFRRSTDRVLVLAETEGRRELAVRVTAADGAVVEAALSGSELPDKAAGTDLALRLLRALEARLQRVTIRDVVEGEAGGYNATLELSIGAYRREVVANVAAGISLAVKKGAPIVMPEGVLAERGWDPTDADARRRLDRAAAQQARELIERGEAPTRIEAPVLSAKAQRLLDSALGRILGQPGVRTVLLTHRSGALQAWRGEGDAELLELYAAVEDEEDDDLSELATNAAFPSQHVLGGIRFETLATDWRLHVALAENRPSDRWPELESSLASLHADLEPVLAAEQAECR